MFTGIIETIQPIQSLTTTAAGRRLTLPLGPLAADARYGDSIAVNGVCLTINVLSGELAGFDVMAETLKATTLGQLRPGQPVNLERAMPANGRFGGHLVQGHVDGIGAVDTIDTAAGQWNLWVKADADTLRFMIRKGSVAIDGVSLTVAAVEPGRFSVSLIPTTLKETTLGQLRPGAPVNLEADLIGKWINLRLDQVLASNPAASPPLTLDTLLQQGFA